MMHAMGFFHEHQRKDRNQYVKVNYANIQSGKLFNSLFNKHLVIYTYVSGTLRWGEKESEREGEREKEIPSFKPFFLVLE